jgi:hypothetical protein
MFPSSWDGLKRVDVVFLHSWFARYLQKGEPNTTLAEEIDVSWRTVQAELTKAWAVCQRRIASQNPRLISQGKAVCG